MKFLLDTCAISELVARHPHPKVVDFIDELQPDSKMALFLTENSEKYNFSSHRTVSKIDAK